MLKSRSKSFDNHLKKMENDSLSMQSLKSDVDNLKLEVIRFSKETSDSIQDSKYQTEASLKQLESKLDKIISKDDTKIISSEDYSSDEESTFNQDRKGRNTVLSAIKNIRSIVLTHSSRTSRFRLVKFRTTSCPNLKLDNSISAFCDIGNKTAECCLRVSFV